MISFGLEEDQQIIQDTVRKFAGEVVRPRMREWERARGVTAEARRQFHELGLGLIDAPEAAGGAGASALTAALVQEELAFGDAGAAVALWAPHLAPAAILELGDEAQARRLLQRFADPKGAERLGAVAWSEKGKPPLEGFSTTAVKKGGEWVLNGGKAFVVNGGRADVTVVFAQVEPGKGWDGIGAFVVEGAAGIKEGARHELLGLETIQAAEIQIEGCVVKDENRLRGGARGFGDGLKRFFARAALTTAARQVGLARASYEYALEYTQERKAFGKPVAHFQAIAFTLADMIMDVDAARWMVWRAANGFTNNTENLRDIALAATHANEAAWRVADNAVQLLGGAGFVQDYPCEKWLRDTKALALTAPTDQLEQLAVASAELGHAIDSGWPSSAIQPIFT
jgi:alkylation response protein AidB-like acyl-CoA dehydrogenase